MNKENQKLAGMVPRSLPIPIRDLTDDELRADDHYRTRFAEIYSRFSLFRILEKNYQEWWSFTRKLLTPGNRDFEQDRLELNRLLMNYLSSAYSIVEHLEKSYTRRFRNDAEKSQKYRDFVSRLEHDSFAYAFFMDFRDYAQHQETPIGTYNRNETTNSVNISIRQSAGDLSTQPRDWERSHLTAAKGDLDLLTMTRDFHHLMNHSFERFMIDALNPDLKAIDEFYWGLTQEVRQKIPNARMVFLEKLIQTPERTRVSFSYTIVQPPNAPYEELGIPIDRNEATPTILLPAAQGPSSS